jgi:hypothetical protein
VINEALKRAAVSTALSSLAEDRRFPKKVFVGPWKDYLFFDSGRLFTACFIELKNLLLREEKASVVALINLGNVVATSMDEPPAIFVDHNTGFDRYRSELMSKGSPLSWLVLVDRYVCASDRGNWSIYCEKENDIGAFAYLETLSRSACSEVAFLLKAISLKSLVSVKDKEFFNFNKLVPEWKAALLAEYLS